MYSLFPRFYEECITAMVLNYQAVDLYLSVGHLVPDCTEILIQKYCIEY